MNMVAFGKKVVKFRIPILIISILLLIPAGLGYVNTRVNYDVLTYLPEDIETMQGQDILVKDFGTGAFSMFIVDGMEDKEQRLRTWNMFRKFYGMIRWQISVCQRA